MRHAASMSLPVRSETTDPAWVKGIYTGQQWTPLSKDRLSVYPDNHFIVNMRKTAHIRGDGWSLFYVSNTNQERL